MTMSVLIIEVCLRF